MRTARLGLEGCESFVDDLIGCRVLYSVRDALLHRSLEIQPWHFPIRYYKGLKRLHRLSSLFLFPLGCWVVHPDLAPAVNTRVGGPRVGRRCPTCCLGVAQW